MDVGNIFIAGVSEVTAGELAGAFKKVTNDNALAKALPVVDLPLEGVEERTEEEGRIGDAAREDDVGTAVECFGDGFGTKVGVGGNVAVGGRQGLVGEGEEVVLEVEDVVAVNIGDFQAVQAEAAANSDSLFGRGPWISGAHIADDARPVAMAAWEDGKHSLDEQRIVAGAWILVAPELGQGDSAFCQALKDEEIQVPVLGKIDGRVNAITGEPCTRTNPDTPHVRSPEHDCSRSFVLVQGEPELPLRIAMSWPSIEI